LSELIEHNWKTFWPGREPEVLDIGIDAEVWEQALGVGDYALNPKFGNMGASPKPSRG